MTLTSDDNAVFNDSHLASYLVLFPDLIRLDLAIDSILPTPTGRLELLNAFTSLTKLETLSLNATPFVGSEFALAPWKAPLKILALEDCDNLSFPDFITLVQAFASTLIVLDIDGTPHDEDAASSALAFKGPKLALPFLDTLVISSQHPVAFLSLFDNCPLADFSFGFCPQITYEDLVDHFLPKHLSTLKQVTLLGASDLSDGQIESLGVWCFAKGVEMVVRPTESDDEESETGDEEGEWSDEEGEEDMEEDME